MGDEVQKIVEEVKVKVAKRVPPGDRWTTTSRPEIIHKTLTDALEAIYNEKGVTQFYMDAREGWVYVVKTEEKTLPPQPERRYSLYGEE
jgi:rRNA pseudouridine-1189 N-methylase Emg1 (Nep1/Mra1 family)